MCQLPGEPLSLDEILNEVRKLQLSGQQIVFDGQVIGQEAMKPNSVRLDHIYLDNNEDNPLLNAVFPTDPTNKSYVDTKADGTMSYTDDELAAAIAAHIAEYH